MIVKKGRTIEPRAKHVASVSAPGIHMGTKNMAIQLFFGVSYSWVLGSVVSAFTDKNHSVHFQLLKFQRRGNILAVRATTATLGVETAAAAPSRKLKISPKPAFK